MHNVVILVNLFLFTSLSLRFTLLRFVPLRLPYFRICTISLSVCLSVYLSACLFVRLSVCLSVRVWRVGWVGSQVHRGGPAVLRGVLRRLRLPRAASLPHPPAGALRLGLLAPGRRVDGLEGHPRRHGPAGARRLGGQRLPLLPLREGVYFCWCCLLLLFVVWVGSTCLFYLFEKVRSCVLKFCDSVWL